MLFLFVALYLLYFVIFSIPFSWRKVKLHPSKLSILYGGPGSGKSTFCAYLAKLYINSGIPVYSNFPIRGCLELHKNDIGKYNIPYGLVIFDEAGGEFNNRDFMVNFSKKSGGDIALLWWQRHRHEGVEVILCSQTFDDMDKKLDNLKSDMWIVSKSIVPGFVKRKRVSVRPDIDKDTHQPVDFFEKVPFSTQRVYGRSVWDMFDSFDRLGLPDKAWNYWGYPVSCPLFDKPVVINRHIFSLACPPSLIPSKP